MIHCLLCKKFGFQQQKKWYEHVPERLLGNDGVMILWDFSIQTDHEIEHNKPDILDIYRYIHDKMKRECIIIDFACPFYSRMNKKEVEMIKKYQDLKRELMMIWKFLKIFLFLLSLEHWEHLVETLNFGHQR